MTAYHIVLRDATGLAADGLGTNAESLGLFGASFACHILRQAGEEDLANPCEVFHAKKPEAWHVDTRRSVFGLFWIRHCLPCPAPQHTRAPRCAAADFLCFGSMKLVLGMLQTTAGITGLIEHIPHCP
jgi:hypothetical protein